MSLKRRVRLNLVRFVLIYGSIFGIMALLVAYDLNARTPWILHPTITQVLGWLTALYGLFWIMWWFFWTAIEGGEETIELYGVTWAPTTSVFVGGGPFDWCRYPLAFGYLEFVWGLGFLVQSTTTVLKAVPLAAVATILYLLLIQERRKLREYGQVYQAYRDETPLFIPRIPDRAAVLHIFRRRKRH